MIGRPFRHGLFHAFHQMRLAKFAANLHQPFEQGGVCRVWYMWEIHLEKSPMDRGFINSRLDVLPPFPRGRNHAHFTLGHNEFAYLVQKTSLTIDHMVLAGSER